MLVSDSQTAYVLALQFKLLSDKNMKIALNRLVENINDYGHLTTGFLGTPFLCHVLSDNGKIVSSKISSVSFGYFLQRGAPTNAAKGIIIS